MNCNDHKHQSYVSYVLELVSWRQYLTVIIKSKEKQFYLIGFAGVLTYDISYWLNFYAYRNFPIFLMNILPACCTPNFTQLHNFHIIENFMSKQQFKIIEVWVSVLSWKRTFLLRFFISQCSSNMNVIKLWFVNISKILLWFGIAHFDVVVSYFSFIRTYCEFSININCNDLNICQTV